jgi:hypothetical protein
MVLCFGVADQRLVVKFLQMYMNFPSTENPVKADKWKVKSGVL